MSVIAMVKFKREWLLMVGTLLVVAALYNHYMGHSAYLIEIVFVVVGCVLALLSLKGVQERTKPQDGMLVVLLSRIFPKDRIVMLLPIAGFLLILVWSAWKILVLKESDLHMEDFIVTLFGLSLVLYYQGPSSLVMQKDFAVLYLLFLTIVFAVIWKAYTLITGDSIVSTTAYSEYYFITAPVALLARAFGIPVTTELNLSGESYSNVIEYAYQGRILRLGIGSGCSGLYSAGLFFSAFLAFVLVRYARIDRRIIIALGLGLLVTWASNIIRMVITIMVGHTWGHPALAFVHSYFGILLFVACAAAFWYPIVRWLDKREPQKYEPEKSRPEPG